MTHFSHSLRALLLLLLRLVAAFGIMSFRRSTSPTSAQPDTAVAASAASSSSAAAAATRSASQPFQPNPLDVVDDADLDGVIQWLNGRSAKDVHEKEDGPASSSSAAAAAAAAPAPTAAAVVVKDNPKKRKEAPSPQPLSIHNDKDEKQPQPKEEGGRGSEYEERIESEDSQHPSKRLKSSDRQEKITAISTAVVAANDAAVEAEEARSIIYYYGSDTIRNEALCRHLERCKTIVDPRILVSDAWNDVINGIVQQKLNADLLTPFIEAGHFGSIRRALNMYSAFCTPIGTRMMELSPQQLAHIDLKGKQPKLIRISDWCQRNNSESRFLWALLVSAATQPDAEYELINANKFLSIAYDLTGKVGATPRFHCVVTSGGKSYKVVTDQALNSCPWLLNQHEWLTDHFNVWFHVLNVIHAPRSLGRNVLPSTLRSIRAKWSTGPGSDPFDTTGRVNINHIQSWLSWVSTYEPHHIELLEELFWQYREANLHRSPVIAPISELRYVLEAMRPRDPRLLLHCPLSYSIQWQSDLSDRFEHTSLINRSRELCELQNNLIDAPLFNRLASTLPFHSSGMSVVTKIIFDYVTISCADRIQLPVVNHDNLPPVEQLNGISPLRMDKGKPVYTRNFAERVREHHLKHIADCQVLDHIRDIVRPRGYMVNGIAPSEATAAAATQTMAGKSALPPVLVRAHLPAAASSASSSAAAASASAAAAAADNVTETSEPAVTAVDISELTRMASKPALAADRQQFLPDGYKYPTATSPDEIIAEYNAYRTMMLDRHAKARHQHSLAYEKWRSVYRSDDDDDVHITLPSRTTAQRNPSAGFEPHPPVSAGDGTPLAWRCMFNDCTEWNPNSGLNCRRCGAARGRPNI